MALSWPTTIEEVNQATHYQICEWWRFLPVGIDEEQKKIMDRIAERLKEFGGFNPQISKALGWDPR